MNKKQLIEAMSERAGMSRKYAETAVNVFQTTLTEALKQGEDVTIPDFGSFQVKERPAREGRNPISGERMSIPARRVPIFKPAKKLRDAIPQDLAEKAVPATEA